VSFRGTIDAGGKAGPPKLPEPFGFGFRKVGIFLHEDLFGGAEDFDEVVEGGRRHIAFQNVVDPWPEA
jgi:hypothetical protein